MKILYLVSGIGPPAGWGTEFIQNLIFKLSQKGIYATIINPIYKHTHPDWKEWTKNVEKKYGVSIISLEAPNWIKERLLIHLTLTPLFVTIAAIKLLKKEGFDSVHEFSSTPIILLRTLILKILFKTPTVFTLSVYNNTILGCLFWFKILNCASFYLIPAQGIIKNLAALGINRKKIIYSPPGIDLNPFQKKIDQFRAKELIGLPKDKFIFSYFGSLTDEKGVYDLIRAAGLISRHIRKKIYIDLVSVWKGSGEHERIKKEIRLLGLPYLRVLDRYVHIPTLLAASDAVILPQQTGHGTTIPPISIIEALASQKPLITTNILGVRELIAKTGGIVIPPKNPELLKKSIEKVYTNYINQRQSSKILQKKIEQFQIEKSISLHINIYQRLEV